MRVKQKITGSFTKNMSQKEKDILFDALDYWLKNAELDEEEKEIIKGLYIKIKNL